MEALINIYEFLTKTMDTPGNFGWFHIVCIGVIAVLSVVLSAAFRHSSDRAVNRFVTLTWVVLLLLEIYKQLIFGFELQDGVFTWDYAWYAFPFQFCSSPLYVLPVIAFTRRTRTRNACIAYMVSFSFFAGLAVLCYPNDVFISTIGINIQTMVHHGSQVILGFVLATRYRRRMNSRFFFGGVRVFVIMCAIAMLLNIGVYKYFAAHGITDTFNMFYVSPYFDCTLPVLSMFNGKVSYPVFFAIYVFGFTLCAILVFGILKGLTRVTSKSEHADVLYTPVRSRQAVKSYKYKQ